MSEEMSSLQGRQANSTEANLQVATRQTVLPPREICERLREAVRIAAKRDVKSMSALRSAISAFTIALRDDGKSPEAVLISLKSVVSVGTLPPIERSHPDWAGYLLREKMSTWCIQDYFNEQSS